MKEPKHSYQLVVRNLDEEVVRALKLRAARHGRSAAAEHREILRQALLPAKAGGSMKDLLLSMPDVGEDADFARFEVRASPAAARRAGGSRRSG